MKKNNNGFTLIELIITIAIVGALSIAVGLSTNKMMQTAKLNKKIANLKDVMNAASVFAELTDNNVCLPEENCDVTINMLIERGLIDKNIVDEKNPMYKDKNFEETDVINIVYENGKKKVTYTCSENTIDLINIDEFTAWEQC